jgi:hypothetical protein
MEMMTYDELVQGWDASPPEPECAPAFSRADVPTELHPLIPYAQIFGLSDDGYRLEIIERAPRELALHVCDAVAEFDAPLKSWLAAADWHPIAEAHAAFTALFIAASEIPVFRRDK